MVKRWIIKCCFLSLVLPSCSKNEESQLIEENELPKYVVIQPDSLSSELKFYKIGGLNFHLPKGFVIRNFFGPDFSVYSIWYPGGIRGGIYFGQYPDVPERLVMLTSGKPIFEEYKKLPHDPFKLLEPERIFDSIGFYTEHYENEEAIPYTYTAEFNRAFENFDVSKITPELSAKFFKKDSLILELSKADSIYEWKSYPFPNEYGDVDVVITDGIPYNFKTHFFTETNKILTTDLVLEFVDQLCKSDDTP